MPSNNLSSLDATPESAISESVKGGVNHNYDVRPLASGGKHAAGTVMAVAAASAQIDAIYPMASRFSGDGLAKNSDANTNLYEQPSYENDLMLSRNSVVF